MEKKSQRRILKKINDNKKIIIGFVLGIIVSGVTVYAVNNWNASEIDFEPTNENWEVSKVDKALDSLYEIQQENSKKFDSKLILLSTGWKKDTGWNSSGISNVPYIDDDYLTMNWNTNTITVKKDCKIKITSFIRNAGATNSAPKYQLWYNGAFVKELSNGTASSATAIETTTVNAKTNDTFYVKMNGGGNNPTFNTTSVEVVLDN